MAFGDVLIVGVTSDRFYRYSNGSWDGGIAVPAGETAPLGITVDSANGDVLIVGVTSDRFYRYSNGSWDAGIAVPAGETLSRGITVDSANGDVLIVGVATGRFYRYSNGSWDAGIAVPAGETLSQGITVDSANGDVLIVGVATGRFYRYSNGSWDAGIAVPAGETLSQGITVDSANGDVLIVGDLTDRFYRYSNGSWDGGIAVPAGETQPRGITVDSYSTAVAPSFTDDTGDAQTWEMGTAIAAVTVPAATGTPTPTYAVEGNLPAGIAFDTATRVISGTPTATGFGTITIRATNSEGTADWTVDYTISAPASAPSRPAAPTLTVGSDTEITAVGVAPNNGGDTITSYDWRHRITSPLGAWVNRSNVSNLTQVFTGLEAARTYRFQFRATNSVGDSQYSPNANATTDATPTTLTAPAFADDTGDAQTWTVGTAIAGITVPTATGNPTPTYAAVGALPSGITFDNATRVIAGTPTAAGSGTITIRATNTEGNDDWTVAYTTNVPVTTTYEVRVKATAAGFTDSEYSDPPKTITITA